MANSLNNKSIFKHIPFSAIISVLGIFIILILLNFQKIRHYIIMRNERDKQKEIVVNLDEKIKIKQSEKENIITGKFENEKIARDTLNMKAEGESVLIINEDETSPAVKIK